MPATRKNMRRNSRKNTRRNNAAAPMAGGMITVGSRAQVFHGTAKRTSGGLTKADLKMSRRGRIVSRKASAAGMKALTRLERAGYKAKKGAFKLFTRKH
jgi:hypothetical protein